jgi:hypothetical protein
VLKRPSAENRREINPALITNVNLPEKTIGNLKENLRRKGRKKVTEAEKHYKNSKN